MSSRKPPSQRDPAFAVQRMSRALQSMSPGSMGGRVANAAPIAFRAGANAAFMLGGGGGYSPPVREAGVFITRALLANEVEQGVIELGRHYRILYLQTSAPARVRLYVTPNDRDSDFGRPLTYDPPPGLGIVMDFLTAPDLLAAPLSPIPEGAIFDEAQGNAVPINVTSVNGGSITVTLTYIALE